MQVPGGVNMSNVLQWAKTAIEAEEKALALEVQKEAALVNLKAAERHRRDAERQAVKARKAWAVLTTPAQNAAIVRRPRAANAVALHEAA